MREKGPLDPWVPVRQLESCIVFELEDFMSCWFRAFLFPLPTTCFLPSDYFIVNPYTRNKQRTS